MTQDEALQKMTEQADAMLSASTEDYQNALLTKWDEFQSRLEADILKIHASMEKDGVVPYSDFVRFGGDKQVETAIAQELQQLHVSIETDRVDALVAQYKDAYNLSAWQFDEATPPDIDVNHTLATEPTIRQFVTEDWDKSVFVTRNAKEFYFLAGEVKTAVTQAMLKGTSVKDLASTIEDIIGDDDSDYRYRSLRIATTELLRSANLGLNHLYDDNEDLISDQYWITRGLMAVKEVCEFCLERAGHTYDEVVDIADEQDMEVDPPIHPFCACRWAARPKNPIELLGPKLGKGIADFDIEDVKFNPQSYKSWADTNLATSDRGNL